MKKTKTLFVTCLYNGLDNTILGGRVGRLHHYFNSLISLLGMGSDIVIYTSENDKKYIDDHIDLSTYNLNITFIIYDLFTHPNHEYFQKALNGIKYDRCYEIMHGKTIWMNNHINDGYDFIYWIDCGLCHGGLFPERFRRDNTFNGYFTSYLFNSKLVENLNKIEDKIIILYGDQKYHVFESSANELFFKNTIKDENCHVVGGMFGGSTNKVIEFCKLYEDILNEMIENNCLEREEQLLTVLYFRKKELFHPLFFTTWHPEDGDMGKYNNENDVCFYKIFEELNK
jgi:hypothetical protein